jgi:hypothetical protein
VGLETEFAFTLPKGYVDASGTLHRQGVMRLATARDEIEPLRDSRIRGADDPYLTILVIARVVTALGTLREVTADEVEGFFAADLAFLQDLYGIVNFGDPADAAQLQASVLPPEPAVVFETAVEQPTAIVEEDAPAAPSENGSSFEGAPSRRRGQIEEVPSRAES